MKTCMALLTAALVSVCSVLTVADERPGQQTSAPAKAEQPAKAAEAAAKQARPRIQMAILLDTSNSMDGLINQARTQLWKIVNEFAKASQEGQQPLLEVALFEYGNSGLDGNKGYLRKVVDLTDNLDRISEELFALTTRGGAEYCGWVISEATSQLAWSKSDDDFKCIYIAGNEPFNQGKINPDEACKKAIEAGIIVNTIHCGNHDVGVQTGWKRGADLADGTYVCIDQDQKVAAIAAPQDKELAELSGELNKTYVYFGNAEQREKRQALQLRQDRLAAGAAPAAAADRAEFKASGLYRAENDLVEQVRDGGADKLRELKPDELPEELKGKSVEEQQAYLNELAKKRAELQERIKKLSAERNQYIAKAQAEQAQAAGAESLDSAVIRTLRQQLEKKNFSFEK
jgi:hypothetical protein